MRTPLPDDKLRASNILLIAGKPEALDKMVNQSGMMFSERRGAATKDAADFGVIEAVIGESSGLIDATIQELTLFDRTELNLLAVSRRSQRFTERLGHIRFQNGI